MSRRLLYLRSDNFRFWRNCTFFSSQGAPSHYQITKGILEHPERYWKHLRGGPVDSDDES